MTSRLDEMFEGLPPRLEVQDVADLLDMTKQGVYKWLNSGTLPGYKLGSTWIILRDELRDVIAAGSNRPPRAGSGQEPAGEEEPAGDSPAEPSDREDME